MASKIQNRNEEIVQHYLSESITVKDIANSYLLSTRMIQRIIKSYGLTQKKSQRQKIAWEYSEDLQTHIELMNNNKKDYKRKWLNPKLRMHILERDNFMCQYCGAGKKSRLHIDHIDKNSSNNNENNLRVLCMQCNLGRNTFMEEIYGEQEHAVS